MRALLDPNQENMTQIIWPSDFFPDLKKIHQECEKVAKFIFGEDMSFDFDMMICKNSNVETPWHQVRIFE